MQGGPGCASQFGNLYELGPHLVQPDLSLKLNPGAWNFEAGLLFIDQPLGTGFSPAGRCGLSAAAVPPSMSCPHLHVRQGTRGSQKMS